MVQIVPELAIEILDLVAVEDDQVLSLSDALDPLFTTFREFKFPEPGEEVRFEKDISSYFCVDRFFAMGKHNGMNFGHTSEKISNKLT